MHCIFLKTIFIATALIVPMISSVASVHNELLGTFRYDCRRVLTIDQSKLMEKLADSAADSGNLELRSQLDEMRKSMVSYSQTEGAYFSFHDSGLKFMLFIRPFGKNYRGMPGAKVHAESIANFGLLFDPFAPGAKQWRGIFGSNPIKLNLVDIQYADDGYFTELPGNVLSLTVEWTTAVNVKKGALIMISRDTGQVFVYSQASSEAGSSLKVVSAFLRGLKEETKNIWYRRSGDWYSEKDLIDVKWINEAPQK